MKKSMMVLISILMVAVLFTGCAGKSDKTVIKVGEVTRSVFYAPQYIALEKGFFEDEGLQVELQTTAGGDKTMTALLSGAIDVALVGSETSIYVYQQGAEDPVINFAQLTQTDGTFLVAREEMPNFTWEDLKNKEFLGQRKGGMPQMTSEFTLAKHGIDSQQDLNLIQNVDFANIAAAFASGTGAFVQLFEPQASIFELEGKGHVVASFGTESGQLPYTVYMARASYMEKNKESIQKFTNAIHKAQKWILLHTPEETAATIAPHFKDSDPVVLASAVKRYLEQGSYATSPTLTEEAWNNLLDVMDHAGELKERIPMEKLVNNDFAQTATSKHP